jgi:hypothetical protein
MAIMESAYTGRHVLLFVLCEPIPQEDLTREVLYNLKSSTYIVYPWGEHGTTQQLRAF